MGNGRWLGRISGSSLALVRLFAGMVVLLLVGSLLLGFASRTHSQNAATTTFAASPIPTLLPPSSRAKSAALALLGQLPIIFEPNQGQADPSVKFLARGAGYNLFLDNSGAILSVPAKDAAPGRSQRLVRMKLVGANSATVASAGDPLPGKTNYLIGNDPAKWHSSIPQFAGVRYNHVYPGIDLVFYGNQGHLEYDFKVAPGADPSQAELQFDSASKLQLSGGDLLLSEKKDSSVRLQAPQIYQRDGDRRIPVAGRFVLRASNRVGFEIGTYDRTRELVIDPVLTFSTYFGGSGSETSPSVAIDPAGNIYLSGTTQGSPEASFSDAATTAQTLIPSSLSLTSTTPSHIFVAKISPSQPPSVAYETFIGGTGTDTSAGIGVDGGGNAYIVGNTTSSDFPTGGIPYQPNAQAKGSQCGGITCTSVFVSALNPSGSSFTYSSYLSGNGNDVATGMTIDNNGDVFLTGTTTSNDAPAVSPTPVDFPATFLPVPFQVAPNGPTQFFATKVNTKAPGVASIAYSTYFGGGVVSNPTVAIGGGIAVDTAGNMYFTGTTNFYNSGNGQFGDSSASTDFPILNAYQPCLDTKPLSTTGPTNPTTCVNPTVVPFPTDAFVAKINPNAPAGTQLLFSTYLGGAQNDTGTSVAVDAGAANVYVTGSTNSSDFLMPTGITPFQLCLDTPPPNPTSCTAAVPTSPSDAYVARFSNPTLSTTGIPNDTLLTYFSYLGGSGTDSGLAIAVDTAGDALITGLTQSTNFPVTSGALQSVLASIATPPQNAFFAHINTATTTNVNQVGSYVTYFGGSGTDRGTSITVDPVSLNTYFAGDTTSTDLQLQNPLQLNGTAIPLNGGANTTNSDAFVATLVPAPNVCITCTAPTFSTTGIVSAGNQLTIGFTVTNQGPDLATGVFVNGTVSSGVTFVSATAGAGSCSTPVGNSIVCNIPILQAGSPSIVNFVVSATGACNACSATAQVIKVNNTNTTITPAIASFQAGGFALAVSPSSRTVAAGATAQYTVQLSPQPSFGANVSLTCSGAPTGASCNFTSSSLTLNGPQSTVLNLTTTPQPITTVASATRGSPLYALWLMVPGMALLGLGAGGKRFRKRWLGLLTLSTLFAFVLFLPACHSGKTIPPAVTGTPTGTYSLTVTATSGTLTQSAPFQLTVTP